MPLHFLVSQLERCAGKILFIGMQPEKIQIGYSISPAVAAAKKKRLEILREKKWSEIKGLEYKSEILFGGQPFVKPRQLLG